MPVLYYIKCTVRGNVEYFYSKNSVLAKILYNKRNSQKDTLVKQILLQDAYEIETIKTWNIPPTKPEINQAIATAKTLALHIATYNTDYSNGKTIEELFKPRIEHWFHEDLTPTTNRYAKIDFIGKVKLMYEVKSLKANYGDFPHTILGTNKLISENIIIIFVFGSNEAYFIRGKHNLFKAFPTGVIKNNNRLISNEVFYIPNEQLTPLTRESSHQL